MIRCYVVGRTAPSDGVVIAKDEVDGIELRTTSLMYAETEACVPEEILEKIANYYGKSVYDLTDRDVAEYLVNVIHLDEKVNEFDYTFEDKW